MKKNTKISGVGIGLRHRHLQEIIEDKPDIPWLEVHTENYFSSGSAASQYLQKIRQDYPLSAHCIGMSLGSAEGINTDHLDNIKDFIERYQPEFVSDHLSWGAASGVHIPDLLPIPYTQESLKIICDNIDFVQNYLGRELIVENPSSYLSYTQNNIAEWEFIANVAKISGCKLLLDVNNIHVSAHNHDFDAEIYINSLDKNTIKEIHLAGYSESKIDDTIIYIDDHGAKVYDEVWELYKFTIKRLGDVPTLIEWDTNVPELDVLMAEKHKAEVIMEES